MFAFALVFGFLIPISASALVTTEDNFLHVPDSGTGCVDAVRRGPSIGNLDDPFSVACTRNDPTPYWDISGYASTTGKYVFGIYGNGTSSTIFVSHQYLYVLANFITGGGGEFCSKYVTDAGTNAIVGTNMEFIDSGNVLYKWYGLPDVRLPESATSSLALCVYTMNNSYTFTNGLTFGTATTTSQIDTGDSYGRIYAVFSSASSTLYMNTTGTGFLASTSNLNTFLTNEGASFQTLVTQNPVSCDTSDLGCQVGRAFTYLFIPSADSVDRFTTISLADYKPFSYVYDMGNLRDDIFDQSTSTLSTFSVATHLGGATGTISILSHSTVTSFPMISLLRTLIAYGLYLSVAYALYRQGLGVFHKQNTA